MKGRHLILFCCAVIILLSVYVSAQRTVQIKNNPPKVEIVAPKHETTFNWDSWINYSIRVTDAEDGSSEFEEISPKEVFLEVTYLPGSSKTNENNAVKAAVISDPPGFAIDEVLNLLQLPYGKSERDRSFLS